MSIPEQNSRRLMYCSSKINSHAVQDLVDTEAAVSVISYIVCKKHRHPVDIEETELLCGFISKKPCTKGIKIIGVTIADQ